LCPGPGEDLDSLIHARTAVIAAQAIAHKFVLVVDRSTPDTHIEAAFAQIIEEGKLHRQTHRVVQGHLQHGEANANPCRAHGQRRGKNQWIIIDAFAGEVVLGEPDIIKAERFRIAGLGQLLINAEPNCMRFSSAYSICIVWEMLVLRQR
jgi:hypothetical protein